MHVITKRSSARSNITEFTEKVEEFGDPDNIIIILFVDHQEAHPPGERLD